MSHTVNDRMLRFTKNLIIVTALAGLSLSGSVTSAQNRIISYQGTLNYNNAPASNGLYKLTVTLYGDPSGTNAVWSDSYTSEIRDGLFNIQLGSGKALPESKTLDQSLWLGVAVNEMPELRPLTKLGAVPVALNVPDQSITMQNLARM